MIAVLERKFDNLQLDHERTLIAHAPDKNAHGTNWTVALPWWLIIRQSVFSQWRNSGKHPVSKNARILIFESLADLYREKGDFDQLVHQVVGSDFAERWKISRHSRKDNGD